jgi:hypothetical protein
MKANWIPIYWEPVQGTGERLMVGVIAQYDGEWHREKVIRDDVLDALYGKSSANPKKLIIRGLDIGLELVSKLGFERLSEIPREIFGLHFGRHMNTEALSFNDLMKQAALLYSSLASLDSYDELEESDSPSQEDTNKRFVTEVRELVRERRSDLSGNFNKSANLTNDGLPVKFGYLSNKAVIHFSVINAVRQPSGVRDARARLWELSNAQQYAQIPIAGLITGVPRFDDPTLGSKQKYALDINLKEIEKEADKWDMRFLPVHSSLEGASKVIEYAE